MELHNLLVIYADGVTEDRNEDHEDFGEARLLTQLQVAEGERSALTLSNIIAEPRRICRLRPAA